MTNYERRAHRDAVVAIRERQGQRLRLLAILTGSLITTAAIAMGLIL